MRRCAAGFAVLLLLATPAHSDSATDIVFYFEDEYGVLHLSNIPQDDRYRRLGGARLDTNGRRDSGVALPLTLVIETASAEGAERTVIVSIAVPSSGSVRGTLDLEFDPSRLEFREASEEAERVGNNRLRLRVSASLTSALAAQVVFVPTAAAGMARLALVGAELETDDGQVVAPILPTPQSIHIDP